MANTLLDQIRKALPKPSHPILVWGIDLGTTNSTITELTEALKPMEVILEQKTDGTPHLSAIIPSIVAVRDNEFWVGEGAKRMRLGAAPVRGVEGVSLFAESKNDIGLRKSYTHAPVELKHAMEVSSTILKFLYQSALTKAKNVKPDRVVITVPASFLANQRRDTLRAAEMAGIDINEHGLLDEPTAALIQYAVVEGLDIPENSEVKVLVFDFGGGTCDVSVVELINAGTIKGGTLATNRYQRLGGGDIDRAIVHEVLIPAFVDQNNDVAKDLTWSEKKKVLEPQLLGAAEQLKLSLCRQINSNQALGKSQDQEAFFARQPKIPVAFRKQRLFLDNPILDVQKFEELLEPFLSTRDLFERESDYRLTRSIFSPIFDALDRARCKKQEIDIILLAGGSSMVPQVQSALKKEFSEAKLSLYPSADDAQLAISRGAAWHALYLQLTGEPLISPIATDGLSLSAKGGKEIELVPAGTSLPYPPSGMAVCDKLAIPRSGADKLLIKVTHANGTEIVFSEVWSLDIRAKGGAQIFLEYCLTANGVLQLSASLPGPNEQVFSRQIANPFVNPHNPHALKQQIEEAEEDLRQRQLSMTDARSVAQIGWWYYELNQNERALNYLERAQNLAQVPDRDILTELGIVAAALGDIERAIAYYGRAFEARGRMAAVYAADDLFDAKRYSEAIVWADRAMKDDYSRVTALVIKWRSLRRLGDVQKSEELLPEMRKVLEPLNTKDDWQLSWCEIFADDVGDRDLLNRIEEARRYLRKHRSRKKTSLAPLPSVKE